MFVDPGEIEGTPEYERTHVQNATAEVLARQGKAPWSESTWLQNLIGRANNGDEVAMDALVQYYSSKEAAKTANQLTFQREDTAYQRLISDMKKAGISPYVLSGATPMVSQSSQMGKTSSDYVGRANNRNTVSNTQINSTVKSVLQLAGVMLSALIMAMA